MIKQRKPTGDRDTDAVLEGLSELDARLGRDLTMREAEAHELVASMRSKGIDSASAFSLLRKIKPAAGVVPSGFERAALCREYVSEYKSTAPFEKKVFFGTSDVSDGRIEYIGNTYTDGAYSIFAPHVVNASAVTVGSFGEICDDVYEGRAEFGILPIETSDNGKLLRFYSLIDRYELKIAAVSSTEAPDGTVTRFALVKKSIEYPAARFGAPDVLEFFVNTDKAGALSDILSAAAYCSMKLIRIDSLPLSYREGQFTLCPAFDVNGADINTFLTYMALDFPQFTPIGIFSYLE